MGNREKAAYLYSEYARYKEAGHTLVASQLLKIADYHGAAHVKEALSYSKKLTKKAVIEKPAYEERPHEGLKKSDAYSDKTAGIPPWLATAGRAVSPYAKAVGLGAAGTAGAAAVALPAASYFANKVVEDSSSSFMDTLGSKVKEYAVPAGLALAATGAAAFGLGSNRGKLKAYESGEVRPMPGGISRRKVANLVAATKLREKVSRAFGEDSEHIRSCDTAISRILFEVDDAS